MLVAGQYISGPDETLFRCPADAEPVAYGYSTNDFLLSYGWDNHPGSWERYSSSEYRLYLPKRFDMGKD